MFCRCHYAALLTALVILCIAFVASSGVKGSAVEEKAGHYFSFYRDLQY